MTAVDVDALDAARAAATAGPWFIEKGGDHHDPWWHVAGVLRERYGDNPLTFGEDGATGRFVVAAVNALPELLAEVRRGRALREAVDRVREFIDGFADRGNGYVSATDELWILSIRRCLDAS